MAGRRRTILGWLLAAPLITAAGLVAQEPAPAEESEPAVEEPAEAGEEASPTASFFASTTVTVTGTEVDTFEVAAPVTVIGEEEIAREAPHSAVDLLRDKPGLDVNGVGPNQSRPIIRGQRGLRILFLENGLRMNNARRQTNFGEIPALVEVGSVQAVEVVRGPASVLYGSDAIGGVLNLVTRPAPAEESLGGHVALRGGSAGDAVSGLAAVYGNHGDFGFRLGASYRDSDDYEAAAGSFGDIRLDERVPVVDTRLTSDSAWGTLSWQAADAHHLSLRLSRYRADETGFGFVEPELLEQEEDFRIRILYPRQAFDRYTLSWVGSPLGLPVLDSAEVQLYYQDNERELSNDIDINIGPLFPGAPDSSVEADTLNFTDLSTWGLRAELIGLAGDRHLLTYGVELYEDDSYNEDSSVTTTTLRFPFPPFELVDVSTDTVPNAPNATNRAWGVFLQDEIVALERLSVTMGARYQQVETRAEATPGWDVEGLDFEDDQVVGAVNVLYRLNDNVRLTGSWGLAFRAPNIVERLFNGPTPEGAGYQVLNPDLISETSESLDLGLKYRRRNAFLEVAVFRNDIDDGIIQYFLTPAEIDALPAATRAEIDALGDVFVVQQRNVDRLRYEGVEVALGYHSEPGFSVTANLTFLEGERVSQSAVPIEDLASDKYGLSLRYQPRRGRWWAEYRVRRNGEERARVEPGEPLSAVGEFLPAFAVHSLSGGVTLFERGRQAHTLDLIVDNLTDELYAEFSNATFFRPQPGRNVTASYRIRF